MWTSDAEELEPLRALKISIVRDSRPLTYADVLSGWQSDHEFRSWFNSLLAEVPYSSFRWETPCVTGDTLSQPFEFVVLDSPGLASRADPDAFAEHFDRAVDGIAVFVNLGRDATLIAPCPMTDPSAYGHLALFVRHAPEPQRNALWRAVGQAMTRRVGTRPVWLSTAGAGVSWLHVRLDDRPKYYGFDPYK